MCGRLDNAAQWTPRFRSIQRHGVYRPESLSFTSAALLRKRSDVSTNKSIASIAPSCTLVSIRETYSGINELS